MLVVTDHQTGAFFHFQKGRKRQRLLCLPFSNSGERLFCFSKKLMIVSIKKGTRKGKMRNESFQKAKIYPAGAAGSYRASQTGGAAYMHRIPALSGLPLPSFVS